MIKLKARSTKNKKTVDNKVVEVIKKFINSPPKGTPIEIINTFTFFDKKTHLPPSVFLETVEQAPIAISITDANARILYVNSTFEKLTGYQLDEIIGQNESILSSKSTPVSIYQNLWETIKNGQIWKGILINHTKDKQEYIAELSISPVLTDENEIEYFLGMHRDITKKYKLEQRLKFQQTLSEAAINSAPMVVAMINMDDGKVLMDNLAYKALLSDFRGIEPAQLFLAALEQQVGLWRTDNSNHIKQKNREFSNIEVHIEPPGNTSARWFSCSGSCVIKQDDSAQHYFNPSEIEQRYLLLIANDITAQRKRINESRLNMIRTAMAEQQMTQTMREAISASIFKLQIPLNMIKAAVVMPGLATERRSLHSSLQLAVESGDEVLQSLQFALPDPVLENASKININVILHEVIKLSTDKLLASSVVIDWQPASVLPFIPGRENALRGLFKYLIDNAIQALNETDNTDKEISLCTRLDHQEVLIEIRDNGHGLTEAVRLKAFEPFYCGWKQANGHAGMGLTMAQEILFNHNGSIEINSDLYTGCQLFIRLPIKEQG